MENFKFSISDNNSLNLQILDITMYLTLEASYLFNFKLINVILSVRDCCKSLVLFKYIKSKKTPTSLDLLCKSNYGIVTFFLHIH